MSKQLSIQCIVIENAPKSSQNLGTLIEQLFPELELIGVYSTVDTALTELEHTDPDVIFVDVQLPNKNGLQLFDQLKTFSFLTVIISDQKEHAIKAIKLNAVDFLLKPYSLNELRKTISKIKNSIRTAENSKQMLKEERIAIPTKAGIRIVEVMNIVSIRSFSTYTNVLTKEGHIVSTNKSIKDFQNSLPEDHFFRIYNSILINTTLIKEFSLVGSAYVIMKNDEKLPISRTRLKEFKFLAKNAFLKI